MKNKYFVEAEAIIDIPFHDVDVMEVVWHGHYLKYFEIARCRLLEKLDYSYPQMRDSGYAWPIVDLQLRFLKPALYADKISVIAGLLEYENRLKIEYQILNCRTAEALTKGYTVQVAYNVKTRELELATPALLWEKINAHR